MAAETEEGEGVSEEAGSQMTLPLLQEFFTEAEAREHVICPIALATERPQTCIGHEGTTCERGEPIGFCGVGPKP